MNTNTVSTVPVGDNLTIRRYPKPPRNYRKRSDIEQDLESARGEVEHLKSSTPPPPVTEKLCAKCTTVYSIDSFKSRSGRLYSNCSTCRSKKSRADYKESRKTHLDRRAIKSQLLLQFGTQCERCGYNEFDSALEFHHRNPRTKDSQVSQLIGQYAVTPSEDNWERLTAEASKCDIYCSNCHQALHANDW